MSHHHHDGHGKGSVLTPVQTSSVTQNKNSTSVQGQPGLKSSRAAKINRETLSQKRNKTHTKKQLHAQCSQMKPQKEVFLNRIFCKNSTGQYMKRMGKNTQHFYNSNSLTKVINSLSPFFATLRLDEILLVISSHCFLTWPLTAE